MRRVAAAAVLAVVLAACSSSGSPAAELQTKMNAIATAANNRDATQVKAAVEDFLLEVSLQSRNGDITSTKADNLRTVAERVLQEADRLESSPTPQATSEAPSPPPSPSPSPSPSPRPSPSPSPSPTDNVQPSTVPPIDGSSAPALGQPSP